MGEQQKKYSLLERDLMEFFLEDTGRFQKPGNGEHRVRDLIHRLYNYPERLYCGYNPESGIRKVKTVGGLYALTVEERSYICDTGKVTWKRVNRYLKSRGLPPLEIRPT